MVIEYQPSTTQLIDGTMYQFLKLTQPYAVDPDSRMFAIFGTNIHHKLDETSKKLGLPSEIALSIDRDIFDLLEPEEDGFVLTDNKTWGSYKVAKALGLYEAGKKPDPNGELYKKSGAWGKAGDPKLVTVWGRDPNIVDLFESELQLNRYRTKLEKLGVNVLRMQLEVLVRDGGIQMAQSRGVERNSYLIPIKQLDDRDVMIYFQDKDIKLKMALADNKWNEPCNNRESWDGARCKGYCEVALYCPQGLLHMKAGIN